MSEYWISKKKYFCRYCDIYIADDAPSRNQHENGMRHKGNVERFVRGLYKAGEKRKREGEEEAREMQRVNQAAEAAYAQDVASGNVKAGPSKAPALRPQQATASSTAAKPKDVYANYSSAATLGYTDPDVERAKAEAAQRREQGVAGAWSYVEIDTPAPTETETVDQVKPEEDAIDVPVTNSNVSTEPTNIPSDDTDARGYRIRRKMATAGLGEIYDPGEIKVKPKVLPTPLPKVEEAPVKEELPSAVLPVPSEPKKVVIGWKKSMTAVEPMGSASYTPVVPPTTAQAFESEPEPEVKLEEDVKPKLEDLEPPVPETAPNLFKKRKGLATSRPARTRIVDT